VADPSVRRLLLVGGRGRSLEVRAQPDVHFRTGPMAPDLTSSTAAGSWRPRESGAHLRDELLLARDLGHHPRLIDAVRQRLLAVAVLAQLHRHHARHGVGVIRRADHDRVDLLVHLVQQLAEILVPFGLGYRSNVLPPRCSSTSHSATMFS